MESCDGSEITEAENAIRQLWATPQMDAEWLVAVGVTAANMPPSLVYPLMAQLRRETGIRPSSPSGGGLPFPMGWYAWRVIDFFDLLDASPVETHGDLTRLFADAQAHAATTPFDDPPEKEDAVPLTDDMRLPSIGDAAVDAALSWALSYLCGRDTYSRPSAGLLVTSIVRLRPELAARINRFEANAETARLRRAVRRIVNETMKELPLLSIFAAGSALLTWLIDDLVGDYAALVPPLGLAALFWSYNRILRHAKPDLIYELPASVTIGFSVILTGTHVGVYAGLVSTVGVWDRTIAIVLSGVAVVLATGIAVAFRRLEPLRLSPGWWLPDPDEPGFPGT